MRVNRKQQMGSSTYATLFLILALIFAAVTIMKLWSPYYDDLAVKTAIKNIAEEDATRSMAPKEIRKTINKRLQVNNVQLDAEEVVISKEDGMVKIDVVYERRIPMYGNIDAMVKFHHEASFSAKR
ncbi:DUF4845 domain-containing protein [Ketobacter sp. MCCC 1A13808]|uniref:DUF4845 domain-containing protein n=1 Tax=Ketobacter sp. MCCC 1A13808 TaxID=2602738 RepID=UPI000F25F3AE|nr:DUF4845 domain-containing protein [Ketobacter sp. MCCC 1A13808]MVF14687.1 DUF4845 domain-containing protein [Ketobacter sp. MCCC 1A13808]RLP53945.1 MAG: DUF4845 domain-containing protein [Ketobacter sp.]